ncbi:dienelactone hydrolase family protein [Glaciibacter flavus]|uniref:dienelactone hydrolase family protein n=1 Tax=Orlajensenia flava TaxID=2565934 RepID=UPI003AFFA294
MADVLLFHHALGLTPEVVWFADALRAAGHTVTTPDLYEGRTFDDLDAGIAHAGELGFDEVRAAGVKAADDLPEGLVYIGMSLGVMPAQELAQKRAGAAGAVFISSFVALGYFGDEWPAGVPVQVHGMDADPIFAGEGDLEAAQALVASGADAHLYLYAGDAHLLVQAEPPVDDIASFEVLDATLRFLGEIDSAAASAD